LKNQILKHKVVFFYIFTFLITWPSWLLMGRIVRASPGRGGIVLFFSTLGGLGPLLALFLIEKLSGKREVGKGIFSRIRYKNTHMRWILLAALLYPSITLLSQYFHSWIGDNGPIRFIKPEIDHLGVFVVPVMVIHFVASLLTSPLFEEPGWRGFALVNLQNKYGRFTGSLIVGVLWWIWHQPMNIPFGILPSAYAFAQMLTFSFFIDSLFNLANRNLFVAMLAHQSYGTIYTFLNQGSSSMFQLVCLVLVVIGLRVKERSIARRPIGQTETLGLGGTGDTNAVPGGSNS